MPLNRWRPLAEHVGEYVYSSTRYTFTRPAKGDARLGSANTSVNLFMVKGPLCEPPCTVVEQVRVIRRDDIITSEINLIPPSEGKLHKKTQSVFV